MKPAVKGSRTSFLDLRELIERLVGHGLHDLGDRLAQVEALANGGKAVRIHVVYEVIDEVVSGHTLAARWNVRTQLLREIARAVVPGLEDKGQRERYDLGRGEQEAVREILLAIDRKRRRE